MYASETIQVVYKLFKEKKCFIVFKTAQFTLIKQVKKGELNFEDWTVHNRKN